jgi:hypothetical protein
LTAGSSSPLAPSVCASFDSLALANFRVFPRPTAFFWFLSMRVHKYHALGNDYLVLNPADFPGWSIPTEDQTRVICHRNFGVGSDGILWGPLPSKQSEFGLRIFNPDGSEAEKSGNGLRIFSRFLWDQGLVKNPKFTVETPGGHVESEIMDNGRLITVAMGKVSFDSAKIPVVGAPREVINETIQIQDRAFTFCAATIGNPPSEREASTCGKTAISPSCLSTSLISEKRTAMGERCPSRQPAQEIAASAMFAFWPASA